MYNIDTKAGNKQNVQSLSAINKQLNLDIKMIVNEKEDLKS